MNLTVQGDRDGHHHDRAAERRQDITAASSGGESLPNAETRVRPGRCCDEGEMTDFHLGRRIYCRVRPPLLIVAQAAGTVSTVSISAASRNHELPLRWSLR